jgi:hypothetical protein
VPRKRLSVASAASSRLEDEGLALPDRPGRNFPTLPSDLTELNDQDLMELMTEFTAWGGYAAAKLSLAEVSEREKSDALELEEAKAMVTGWEGQATDARVAVAKARKLMDADVQAAKDEMRKVYARRKLLQTMVDRLDRNAALVSRELTRRTGAEPVQRRTHRWGGGS